MLTYSDILSLSLLILNDEGLFPSIDILSYTTGRLDSLQAPQPQTQQEDVQAKLLKYADLQKGILSDEEFQKLKADLLSKM